MAVWSCNSTPDGRVYYFRAGDNASTTWNKPADYDGPDPPALEQPKYPQDQIDAAWAEAKDAEGKPYYWNRLTKATVREQPEAFLKQQQQQQQQNLRPAPTFVAGGGFGGDVSDQRMTRRDDRRGDFHLPQKPAFEGGRAGGTPWESRQDNNGFRGPMPVKTDEPEFASPELAEEAFMKLLKRHNIASDTPWKDVLRMVVRERDFRAIKEPRERREAFEKYCHEVRVQEKSKEKERKERLAQDFRRMLTTHEDIKHYTRWKTAKPLIELEAAFKSVGDDADRKQMFEEYILELQRKHAEQEVENHHTALHELRILLQQLIVDPDMKWDSALGQITNDDRFASESHFASLHKLDILNTFDAHVKALDRAANDSRQKERNLRVRRDRQARDAYKDLLAQKVKDGELRANTKWMDFLKTISSDERYTNMLRTTGSTPLELFWDVIEDLEQELRAKRHIALDVLEEVLYEVTLETSPDDFAKVMASNPKTAGFDHVDAGLILEKLKEKVRKRVEEDKHHHERKQRKAADSLRSVIKHLEPPVRLGDSYDDVASRIAGCEEYKMLDEKQRKLAFEKHMDRLQEKEIEFERDRAARRDRNRDRDRDRERERDRERDRRHGTRTRSPEADAYEADRRKAQADRERQYRKASFGLTPPPRDRRSMDLYDRDRRSGGDRHDGIYERERRERELERERSYVSRADPRDKGRTLDYGDDEPVASRPGSTRKRQDSDGSLGGKRENKRMRAAEPMVVEDEAPALQSGSEEGEIEEV
nr:pre-mrna-processing protein prp40 [Quercus suber]